MQEIKEITKAQWDEHVPFMKEKFPQYSFA
jgi:hypothetical protein